MGKPTCANRPVWTSDHLAIMPGINSGSVDLIYLNAPFNSKADHAAPIGSKAAEDAYKHTWTPSDADTLQHLEVGHIIARAKGGTNHICNLQLLCGDCNRVTGDRGMEYLRTKLQLPRAA